MHTRARCVFFECAARDRSTAGRADLNFDRALAVDDFPRPTRRPSPTKAETYVRMHVRAPRSFVRVRAFDRRRGGALKVGRPIRRRAESRDADLASLSPMSHDNTHIFDPRFPITSNYFAATCCLPRRARALIGCGEAAS